MNPLIEKLAREAGDECQSTLPDRVFLERFAQAVARRCADLALQAHTSEEGWVHPDAQYVIRVILTEFGLDARKETP